MLLEDNHPCAHYNYLVNVQTGNRKQAGTTAKVCASDLMGQLYPFKDKVKAFAHAYHIRDLNTYPSVQLSFHDNTARNVR